MQINGIEAVELLASADPSLAAETRNRGRKPVVVRTADQPLTLNGIEGVIWGTESSGPGSVYRLDSADPLLALAARQRGQRAVVVVDSSGAVVPATPAEEWYESASYDTLAAVMDFNNDRYALPTFGSELVTNGSAFADTTGWTAVLGSISAVSGVLRATGNGSQTGRAQQTLSGLTIGSLYRFLYTRTVQTGGNATATIGITSGTTAGAIYNVNSAASGAVEAFFTATQTTHYLMLGGTSASNGTYTDFDDVSVKEVILTPTGRTYGSELLDNGTFTDAAVLDASLGWVLKTPAVGTETMTISGGTLNLTGDGTNSAYADQSFTTVASQVYELTFTVTGQPADTRVSATQGNAELANFTPAVGTHTVKFTASGTTTWIRFRRTAALTAVVDNVSIRALTAIGTYPKREATFDECFAYTAASDVARTYTDVNGVLKNDLAVNARRMTYANGKRQLRLENAGTNLFLNSATGVTQGVTVAAVAHTLSFYGTGSITLTGTSTAGPLNGTGANDRVTLSFTPTAGTLTLTVAGSITKVQLEASAFATDYIPTAGASVTRAIETARLSPLLEAVLQRAQGSVVVRAQNVMSTGSGGILGLGASPASLIRLAGAPDGTSFANTNDASSSIFTGNFAAGTAGTQAFGVVAAFDAAGRVTKSSGSATVTSDAAATGARTTMYLSRFNSGGTYGYGYYDLVGFSPERLPNTDLIALAVAAT
jgi:hypothetical protein